MKHLLTTLFFCLGAINLQAQTINTDELFGERVEVYFEFEVVNPSNLAEIASVISIDHGEWGKVVRAYANERQFKVFLEMDLPYTILPPPSTLIQPKMMDVQEWRAKGGTACLEDWDFYPTYEAYETMMYDFEANYRSICRIEEFGVLPSGRKLLAAVISKNVDDKEAEPQFLYTSSMHGDEIAGYPMMLQLIDHLLCEYGTNEQITNLINEMEIWINPLANPNGTYASGNNTVYGATRSNASGHDLNRNYPDFLIGDVPFNQKPMQLETDLFLDLAEANHFVLAANFHGGTEVVNYPWDTQSKRHVDDSWFECVSVAYADLVQSNSPNNYFEGFGGDGVTNGYDWYEVDGGRQDYMNYFHNCREVTIELSDQKLLNENNLANHWDYNRAALLDYMERALQGFQGVVTDVITGEPIEAKVFVKDHDAENSEVYANGMGRYSRPIDVGVYDLVFSAEGYLDVEYKGMDITKKHQIIRLDVAMLPDIVGVEELVAEAGFALFPNPVKDLLTLQLEEKAELVQIFDIGGQVIREFSPLEEKMVLDVSEFAAGVYWVKVIGKDWSGSQKLVVVE